MTSIQTQRYRTSEGEILGKNRRHVWIKIPGLNPNIILTMPRKVLPRGMAQARLVEISYDGWSLDFNGHHFVASLEIKRVIEEYSVDESSVGEPSTDLDSEA